MFDPKTADPMEKLRRSYSILTSLRKFDELEVDSVYRTQIAMSRTEYCRIGTYLRVQRDVDSMTELRHAAHFQALSMLARSIFELSLDIRLMQSVPDAAERMMCFQNLEWLRAEKAAIALSKEPSGSPASKTLLEFEAIQARAAQLWGHKFSAVTHWSGRDLKQRVSQLADDNITQMYVYTYRRMSWQTHPGLQGSYRLPASAFPIIARSALDLAAFSYVDVLHLLTRGLGLKKYDPLIDAKLTLALTLPHTDGAAEEFELRRSLGL